MIFYTKQHKYYCGIDREGKVLVHRNVAASPDVLLKVIEPYREDICIGGMNLQLVLGCRSL